MTARCMIPNPHPSSHTQGNEENFPPRHAGMPAKRFKAIPETMISLESRMRHGEDTTLLLYRSVQVLDILPAVRL